MKIVHKKRYRSRVNDPAPRSKRNLESGRFEAIQETAVCGLIVEHTEIKKEWKHVTCEECLSMR